MQQCVTPQVETHLQETHLVELHEFIPCPSLFTFTLPHFEYRSAVIVSRGS
eukprot:m.27753 g.27753  ORF g.27753 m.27753 type:complete len:51 (+) comp30309_c0_seq1:538-690(+)